MGSVFARGREDTLTYIVEIEEEGKRFDTREEVIAAFPDVGSHHQEIAVLGLSKNSYSPEACEAIAELISSCPNILQANLSDMFVGRVKEEVVPAITSLCNAFNPESLKILDVSDNAFGPAGIEGVVGLLKAAVNLKELQVNNNGLGAIGASRVAEGIDGLQLTIFSCERNRIKNEGILALAAAFKQMRSLQRLNMSHNYAEDEGMVELLRAVAYNTWMQSLNLEDNKLKGHEVAQTLQFAIECLDYLSELNVGDCLLGDDGCICLLQALRRTNILLASLNLCHNELSSSEVLHEISDLVEFREGFELLWLQGNEFSKREREALQNKIESFSRDIKVTYFTDDEEDLMEDELDFD